MNYGNSVPAPTAEQMRMVRALADRGDLDTATLCNLISEVLMHPGFTPKLPVLQPGKVMTIAPYAPLFGKPVAPWHRWFAWRPVESVDRGWVWLRLVWRRRIHKHQHLPGGADFWFQHAVDMQEDRNE